MDVPSYQCKMYPNTRMFLWFCPVAIPLLLGSIIQFSWHCNVIASISASHILQIESSPQVSLHNKTYKVHCCLHCEDSCNIDRQLTAAVIIRESFWSQQTIMETRNKITKHANGMIHETWNREWIISVVMTFNLQCIHDKASAARTEPRHESGEWERSSGGKPHVAAWTYVHTHWPKSADWMTFKSNLKTWYFWLRMQLNKL